jgi:hypothetical protein
MLVLDPESWCIFHISKSGRVFKVVAVEPRASATSELITVGGGVVNVVIVAIGDSRCEVRGGVRDGIPGSSVLRCIEVPVGNEGRASRHGADASR